MGTYLQLLGRGVVPWLLLASLTGWGWLLGSSAMLSIPAFCGSLPLAGYALGWQGIEQALLFNPPGQLLLAWLLMLLAMTPLLLVRPLVYICQRSLRRRRWQAVLLFVLGFVAVWTLVGLLLMSLVVGAQVWLGLSATQSVTGAVILSLLWQASPVKQHCLNQCHRQPRISAFGMDFIGDCLGFGVSTGGWCVGSCWPLMLLPMLAQQGHVVLMLLCMVWMLYERLLQARPVRWYWPLAVRWRS
ncbi:hypothetical protein GV819_20075 [Pseudomonas sp. Fl5BN2]|uniref:copper chaperone n=1 Tax=Pseudomonas sp. Fl5BN2 TaxID=2697652 RepID=UPI001378B420|nr:DUF2182 domain-containing protein [Pseudomonas sp. Fl5BN2]NBF04582.1 hypothetical protein [Pseudomonas sp. Fl5BN2]